jgi:hypothetical protein
MRTLLLIALAACASRPNPNPNPNPNPIARQNANPAATCPLATCTLHGDFDGDSAPDTATIVRKDRRTLIHVDFADAGKPDELLGATPGAQWLIVGEDGEPSFEDISDDFSFLMRWGVEKVPLLVNEGQPGEAILLDGGDSAVIIFRRAGGWRIHYLGY